MIECQSAYRPVLPYIRHERLRKRDAEIATLTTGLLAAHQRMPLADSTQVARKVQ